VVGVEKVVGVGKVVAGGFGERYGVR